MSFNSLEFAAFAVAAVVVLNLFREKTLRLAAVLLLNAIFLVSFATSFNALLPILGFAAAGYLAILLAKHTGTGGLLVFVAACVALFIWLKRYTIASFLPFLPAPYVLVGLSYILFRILHLIIDVNQGAQKVPSIAGYVAYLFFFLNFVSGPIQRHEDFAPQLDAPRRPLSESDVQRAIDRLLLGFFLILVVTPETAYLLEHVSRHFYEVLTAGSLLKLLTLYSSTAVVFTAQLYWNFVGYMEIVIGLGILCGFVIPENFDRPYLSSNFLDFWARWHITLSEWFKFYVFNPILKALSEKWGNPTTMLYLGIIAFFVTFLIMGIWHGSTAIYVVYGLFLGLGTSLNKFYQIEASKRLGKRGYKMLTGRGWYQHLSRALALSYFIIAITCIWLSSDRVGAMASIRGMILVGMAFILLVAGIWLLGAILAVIPPFKIHRLAPISNYAMLRPAWAATKAVAIILLATSAGNSAPEFAYKVF